MTDLVERLKDWNKDGPVGSLCNEAASLIESQARELAERTEAHDGAAFHVAELCDKLRQRDALIERLRGALEAFVKANENGPANEWVRRMADCHKKAKAALQERHS